VKLHRDLHQRQFAATPDHGGAAIFADGLDAEDFGASIAPTLAGRNGIISKSYTVHATIDVPLQRSAEEALQEGLSRFERESERVRFQGPEANLSAAVARIEGEPKKADPKPAWQRASAFTCASPHRRNMRHCRMLLRTASA